MSIHINEAMKSFIHPLIYIAEQQGPKSKGFQTPFTRFAKEMRQAVYFSCMWQRSPSNSIFIFIPSLDKYGGGFVKAIR